MPLYSSRVRFSQLACTHTLHKLQRIDSLLGEHFLLHLPQTSNDMFSTCSDLSGDPSASCFFLFWPVAIEAHVYGHRVTVETDHKPLVSISQKPIHTAPKRLQRMLLRLQRYDLHITYKKGLEMFLAVALSRAYPKNSVPLTAPQSEFCHAMEELELAEHLPISSIHLKQI